MVCSIFLFKPTCICLVGQSLDTRLTFDYRSNGLEEAVLDIFSANNLLPLVAAESERGGG